MTERFLAGKVARALADCYFQDCPDEHVEVVDDSKVLFHCVNLKPMRLHPDDAAPAAAEAVMVTGSVEGVEFSWQWSCTSNEAAAGLVDHTTLVLQRVRLCIATNNVKDKDPSGPTATDSDSCNDVPMDPNTKNGGSAGFLDPFLQQFTQQIKDTLTIHVHDVELVAFSGREGSHVEQVVMQAESLTLDRPFRTNKYDSGDDSSSFSQQLAIVALRAFVRKSAGGLNSCCFLTLLESFSYAVTITRCPCACSSSLRDVWQDLEVIGHTCATTTTPLVFHAGRQQLKILVPVLETLFASFVEKTVTRSRTTLWDLLPGSKLMLPLPETTIVLPNDSRIHLNTKSILRCNAGGSVFEWIGSGGIELNTRSFFQCADGASWRVDLVRFSFSIFWGRNSGVCVDDTVQEQNENAVDPRSHSAIAPEMLSVEWDEGCVASVVDGLLEFGLVETWSFLKTSSLWSLEVHGLSSLLIMGKDRGQLRLAFDNLFAQWPADSLCLPLKFQTNGLTVARSSSSETMIRVPGVALECGELSVLDRVVCQTFAATGLMQEFLSRLVETEWNRDWFSANEAPFVSLKVHQVDVSVNEPALKLVFLGFELSRNICSADGSTLTCEHVRVTESSGTSTVACSRIHASCVNGNYSDIRFDVDAMYIPDFVFLPEPSRAISLSWSESALSVKIPSASVVVLEQFLLSANFCKAFCETTIDVEMCIARLELTSSTSIANDSTLAKSVYVTLRSIDGLNFQMKVGSLKNRWLKMLGSRVSGTLNHDNPDGTVSNFDFQPELVMIAANLSSVDVRRIFKKQESLAMATKFPQARVGAFSARISVDGKMLGSTASSLRTTSFEGDEATTFWDIVEHLKRNLVRELPSLYNNGLVMGESATDLTAKAAGRIMAGWAMSGAVSATALGSICALVVTDIVKGSLILGRTARGASTEEKHYWTDFPRGVLAALNAMTIQGRCLNRRTNEGNRWSYFVEDFRAGVRHTLAKYFEENKARFGAAGGSVMGMALGVVCYGFVGVFIGSNLGGRLGAKLLQEKGNEEKAPKYSLHAHDAVAGNDMKTSGENAEEDWVFLETTAGENEEEYMQL